jgi:hypothetical protein
VRGCYRTRNIFGLFECAKFLCFAAKLSPKTNRSLVECCDPPSMLSRKSMLCRGVFPLPVGVAYRPYAEMSVGCLER